jgi:outer membrane lipoprotein-sorting protein
VDAMTLLREVSDAYRGLKTLAVEASHVTESGDEDSNQRGEQRVRFFYAAPDRFRFESGGMKGMVQVSDGSQMHTVFHVHGQGPQYTSIPAAQMQGPRHLFRSDFPFAGGDEAFLYQGLDERVAAAQIVREEGGCHVVSVTYEPSRNLGIIISAPAVVFRVNAESRMIMGQQGEIGHRFPTEEEVTWTRHAISVRTMRVNEPLPGDTFQFVPPPEVTEMAQRCGVSMSGGAGFIESGTDEQHRLEHRGSHEWNGDTLVEHSKWKIRGMTLTFERRLSFTESELAVAERVIGPKGSAEGSYRLPI